jgi:hypothetical protein
MVTLAPNADVARRLQIFRAVAPYIGKVLPASFFQKTSATIPDVPRVHHLIEGIYKPAWSSYSRYLGCLTVWSWSQLCR